MADNTVLSVMAAGDVIATKDISGVKYPRGITGFVNLAGTAVEDVSPLKPLPIVLVGADGTSYPAIPDTLQFGDARSLTYDRYAASVIRKDIATSLAATDNTYTAMITDAFGRLHCNVGNTVTIADGGGSITVDGSVSITGTVAVSNFPATQPVSAASLPLPTGAATSAKQPAFGPAGTASADVLTVQGRASMTPILVNGSAVTQPVSIASPIAVTGTFWQATQPVSGSVSVGNFPATQPVSGTVAVSSQPARTVSRPQTDLLGTPGSPATIAAASTATATLDHEATAGTYSAIIGGRITARGTAPTTPCTIRYEYSLDGTNFLFDNEILVTLANSGSYDLNYEGPRAAKKTQVKITCGNTNSITGWAQGAVMAVN